MHALPKTRTRAKRLRREMTWPERRLWQALRAHRLDGLHFRRQHPFGPYVLDFYCVALKLAVEVDGGAHNIAGARERDAARDAWLHDRGVDTLRLPAGLVENRINDALALIRAAVARCRLTR